MPPIHTTPRGIRQAVKQFKTDYPQHAQRYAVELKQARQLVKQKSVHRDEKLGFLVGALDRTEVYRVADHRCACGEKVCAHRIAVNLAVMAEHWDEVCKHVAKSEAILEANEVRAELAPHR
jgi:hypothetical protein